MNDQEFIVMVKEMVLAPDTVIRKEWVLRLMEIIVKRDLEIRKYQEREIIREKHVVEPLIKKLEELEKGPVSAFQEIPEGGVFVTPEMVNMNKKR